MTVIRRRPHITMTPSADTVAAIRQVGEDMGIYSLGVIVDFIVTDWLKLRRAEPAAAMSHPDHRPDVKVSVFDE